MKKERENSTKKRQRVPERERENQVETCMTVCFLCCDCFNEVDKLFFNDARQLVRMTCKRRGDLTMFFVYIFDNDYFFRRSFFVVFISTFCVLRSWPWAREVNEKINTNKSEQ